MRTLLSFLLLSTLAPGDIPEELKELTAHDRAVRTTAAYWECYFQYFDWNFGATEIQWQRLERPNNTASDWRKSTNAFTTSYEITAACCRAGGDDVFVAGKQSDGDIVIERWTFSPRDGRWQHVPPAMQPIGTQMPVYSGTTAVKGGTWTTPPETHASPRRAVVLESNSYSLVRGMDVDPEGRFLLFQDHDDGTLYRIRLDEGTPGAPEVLFTAAQIPSLAATVWIRPCDQISSGHRVWVLLEPDTSAKQKGTCATVLLWDTNNDGAFDSSETMLFKDYQPIFLPTVISPSNPCRFPWKAP